MNQPQPDAAFVVSRNHAHQDPLVFMASITQVMRPCEACGMESLLPDLRAGVDLRILEGRSLSPVMYCGSGYDGRAGLVATREAAEIMARAGVICAERDCHGMASVSRDRKTKSSLSFRPKDHVFVLPEVAAKQEARDGSNDVFACLTCRRLTPDGRTKLRRRAAEPAPQTDAPEYLPNPTGVLPPDRVALFSEAPHYTRLLARLPFLHLCRENKWKALAFDVAELPDVLRWTWNGIPIHYAPWPPTVWTPPEPNAGRSVDGWTAELIDSELEYRTGEGRAAEQALEQRLQIAQKALVWSGGPAVGSLAKHLNHADGRVRQRIATVLYLLDARKIPLPDDVRARMISLVNTPSA
jgi:hypothetical protein